MYDFSLLVSLPANNFSKTFQGTTSVMMEQQTKDVQSPTEFRAKSHHQYTTVLDVTISSVSNTTMFVLMN